MFFRRPSEEPVEQDFAIEVSKQKDSVIIDVEWGLAQTEPDRVTLRLTPVETHELIRHLNEQLVQSDPI